MTNTLSSTSPGESGSVQHALLRNGSVSLVEQIVDRVRRRIDEHVFRAGSRLPSIREFAQQHQVSRHTVVAAFDRLVASGMIESRRGSGFYVRINAPADERPRRRTPQQPDTKPTLDVTWLVRNMFRQLPLEKMPGAGLLPKDWLEGTLVANGLRAISRANPMQLLPYGTPLGFLPLRQQLQIKLADFDIAASPEQIITTHGVTQAIDIIVRQYTRHGDTILVDDPSWFMMFAMFAAHGTRVIGVPRLADGPDLTALTELIKLHKPKLYVFVSVLHNPTSGSLSAAKAFQILKLAEEHDFHIVEDDIYADLHPGASVQPATRISALDQLNRVFYLGGFSKSLSASLRCGFIAAPASEVEKITDGKILSTLTTSEINERVLYQVLSEGQYRKHLERLRNRLDQVRETVARKLERIGMHLDSLPAAGMFFWVDAGCDTTRLASRAMDRGLLLAPGSLFSPQQQPSSRMRINISAMSDPDIWGTLADLAATL